MYFLKLYVIDYAITVVPIFLPLSPLHPTPPPPTSSDNAPTLFMSMGHVYKFFGSSIPILGYSSVPFLWAEYAVLL